MASVFDLFARPYDFLVSQSVWRTSCESLVGRFPTGRDLNVLDLGCGSGASAIAMAETRGDLCVTGVDCSDPMLALARRARERRGAEARVRFVRADAASLPFASGAFDAVTTHSVLYLVGDRQGLLCEARRVLREGGRCVLMEPAAHGRLRRAVNPLRTPRFALSMLGWRAMSLWKGRYTRESLARALERAGFANVEVEETLGGRGWIAVARR